MVKQVKSALIIWLFAALTFSVMAYPQSTPLDTSIAADYEVVENNDAPLTQLGSEYQNGIRLLQNRFRIDYEVKEITMVFFREYGSIPIVLVRPDGSKLFLSNADGDKVFWFDSATYDMISIKDPMPGPWQAVGNISPESRVMVISNLKLHAEPLPEIIFSGEIMKQTAHLTNDGVPIDYTAFSDVVELSIAFSSTNNTESNNFGAKPEVVAVFEDNGRGRDERPYDGVFTGQFNLAIADGEWIPTYSVSTPMFTRDQVDNKLTLLPNPIKLNIELDGGGDGYHKLTIDAEREHVDMSTLLIDGKIRFPNGDIQNFSNTEMNENIREHLIVNYEYGVYRVKLTAYGNTLDGREFILDVPEYSFLSEEPEPVVAATINSGNDIAAINNSQPQSSVTNNQMPVAEQKMSTTTLVSIIVAINIVILVVGGGLIWFITSDKKIKVKGSKTTADNKDNAAVDNSGFFAKIFRRKSKESKQTDQQAVAADSDPGFMDLTIPNE